MNLAVARLMIWPLSIPMRRRFRHAAAQRQDASPIVVQIDLNCGVSGFGETHPRPYVTGETPELLPLILRDLFLPRLHAFHPGQFAEALELIADLPETDPQGKPVTATRAAVELALLDAYSRAFESSLESVAGWLGLAGLGGRGSLHAVRYSGVLSAETPAAVRRSIRLMRLYGLRDFKVKVGDEQESDRLRCAVETLRRSLSGGRTTLRVDVNGGWDLDTARRRLREWRGWPLACVEQPLPRGTESQWAELAAESPLPLMADESLATLDDAQRLIEMRSAAGFNIRIAKNGGLIPSIKMAALARKAGLQFQLGCLVGETSILSAAGRWFLHLVPGVRFAEGSFGRHLLAGDVTRRPVRFGWGGRATAPRGPGLGIDVDAAALERFCRERPTVMAL